MTRSKWACTLCEASAELLLELLLLTLDLLSLLKVLGLDRDVIVSVRLFEEEELLPSLSRLPLDVGARESLLLISLLRVIDVARRRPLLVGERGDFGI